MMQVYAVFRQWPSTVWFLWVQKTTAMTLNGLSSLLVWMILDCSDLVIVYHWSRQTYQAKPNGVSVRLSKYSMSSTSTRVVIQQRYTLVVIFRMHCHRERAFFQKQNFGITVDVHRGRLFEIHYFNFSFSSDFFGCIRFRYEFACLSIRSYLTFL